MTELNSTGIAIDVDACGPLPSGGCRYVRVRSPVYWPNNAGAQVDSIEIVPSGKQLTCHTTPRGDLDEKIASFQWP